MTAVLPVFRIERQQSDDGSVFRLVGTLAASDARRLERMLAGPASDGGVLTLDLGQLESCDVVGINLLVALTKRARTASGDLLLRSVPAEVRATFSAKALEVLHVAPPSENSGTQPPHARYLFRAGESVPFAYASSRHDYSLVSDDSLWAHVSHDWLLAAGSGEVLAHRTRGAYFSPDTAEHLYSEESVNGARHAD